MLQLFTSSLYLAALVASFGASKACSYFGRKPTIFVASILFIIGAVLSALAEHMWILILGRIFFGIAVGFGNELAIGIILSTHLSATGSLNKKLAAAVVVLVCTYVMSFAWSWGPLGWLIPSETFPMETRTAGFAFAVSANMMFTFLIAQAFLSMLCTMQASIFFFFSAWIVTMGVFVIFLLPETKGVPIDSMVDRVWKQHPVWKRFFDDTQEL
nr:sugar transport protein 8-like [Ipomoea batatas]GMD79546.1 sugar transport protein 8-like [Ipomoea batatas]